MGATAGAALAAPANPDVVETLRQPDGSTLKVHLWGDEFLHGYETLNGYTLAYDRRDDRWEYAERTARGYLRPSGDRATRSGEADVREHLRPTRSAFNAERREAGAPALGALAAASAPAWAGPDTKVLFLVAEFTDAGCTFTPAQFQNSMFGTAATGPGNLDDYFEEVSYGKFGIDGTVVGDGADCIHLGDTRAHYNTAAGADDDLVREAVAAADDDVDFKQYDNDGDGTVDALGIIYAGGGPHDGCSTDNGTKGSDDDNLWPHSGGVDGAALKADGKTIRPFIINSELTYAVADPSKCDRIQSIGLFAHELGHSLGLPDLYDTDIGSGGVHSWSAMASQYLSTTVLSDTPPHYDPWSKAILGWVTPTAHQPADRVLESLPEASGSPEVHELLDNPGGFELGVGAGEYFLVENRQKTGFDQQLPGCGILVWHIDEARKDNTGDGHTAAVHRRVDVEQADGLQELEGNREADAGDPFPGSAKNTLFADGTTPSSKRYDGTSTDARMRVKSTACATDMDVAFGPNRPPAADAGGPYTTPEGSDVGLDAGGSADPDGDALTYAWDLDDDGQFDDSTDRTPTFTDVGDDGVHDVAVQVTDTFGDTSADRSTVTVTNVAPTAGPLTQDGPLAENERDVTVSGVISDPGWEDDLSATVDWGDGLGAHPVGGDAEGVRPDATLAVSPSHRYGDDGAYTVTICGDDGDGGVTDPCATTVVVVGNVAPTAAVDESGATVINGIPVVLGTSGGPTTLSARSTDPGSDDLSLRWTWDDGSPDTVTTSLVNPPSTDPPKSPTVQPRDVTDTQAHRFEACVYDVRFSATDDDGASASDLVKVLIVGTTADSRPSGWWAKEYRHNGGVVHSDAELTCLLEITGFVSRVFDEARDASTFDRAQKVLFAQGAAVTKRDQLDRDLLTAWLNFADGAVGYGELVDTGAGKVPFHVAMEQAERVRLDPAATPAQIDAQRQRVGRITSST